MMNPHKAQNAGDSARRCYNAKVLLNGIPPNDFDNLVLSMIPDTDENVGNSPVPDGPIKYQPPTPRMRPTIWEQNQQILWSYLGALGPFYPFSDASEDIASSIIHLNPPEILYRFVSSHPTVRNFFETNASMVIHLDAADDIPARRVLSFLSAQFVFAGRLQPLDPTKPILSCWLAFFCRHRRSQSGELNRSGALGLMRSLNRQLMQFIVEHLPAVILDEDFVGTGKLSQQMESASNDYGSALQLFERFVATLTAGERLVIVIDDFKYLNHVELDGDHLMKALTRIMVTYRRVLIKIIITGSPGFSFARAMADDLGDIMGLKMGKAGVTYVARLRNHNMQAETNRENWMMP
ncbi:hypothetical protein B0H66DRAFT_585560 [Apodospora peruviana]|uniref:Uncharacterized protein n=1 Tax=Apodospora peruviana TaxID=516989 RepID=A0AAE0MEP6_9PEZI|nr:hypothetical protein B0H66DRAFT_585560 [Apodospora peruviana]